MNLDLFLLMVIVAFIAVVLTFILVGFVWASKVSAQDREAAVVDMDTKHAAPVLSIEEARKARAMLTASKTRELPRDLSVDPDSKPPESV